MAQIKAFKTRQIDKTIKTKSAVLQMIYDALLNIYKQEEIKHDLPQTQLDHVVGVRGCQEIWMVHSNNCIQVGMQQYMGATDARVHPYVPVMRMTFNLTEDTIDFSWRLDRSSVISNKLISMGEYMFDQIAM